MMAGGKTTYITDRQNMILQMFDEDKTLSRERLCEKTGLSDATIKREIAYLRHVGKLIRIGSLNSATLL